MQSVAGFGFGECSGGGGEVIGTVAAVERRGNREVIVERVEVVDED